MKTRFRSLAVLAVCRAPAAIPGISKSVPAMGGTTVSSAGFPAGSLAGTSPKVRSQGASIGLAARRSSPSRRQRAAAR